MESKTFRIPNISCGHCVMTIKQELGRIDGVASVDGDPGTRTVEVRWEPPATLDKIRSTLKEINYPEEE
jgi:copper chaperone